MKNTDCRRLCLERGGCEHKESCSKRCKHCGTCHDHHCHQTAGPATKCQPDREPRKCRDWFYIFDAHGIILYSQGCPAITGYADSDLVGESIYDHLLLDPDVERLIHREGDDLSDTVQFIARNRTVLDLHFIANPVIHRTTLATIAFQVTAHVSCKQVDRFLRTV